jgi:two-component system phosphate regulon sensor histidine kinase PhoR
MITTLSDERGRIADVLDSLGEAVISIDPEGVINTINASAKSLFGVEDKARGRKLLEFVEHPALIDLTEAGQEGRHESAEFDYETNGTARTISGETFPRRSGAGSVIVLRDVTELRRLETIRSDFVANVSHELRTPVSIVQASAETLMTAADDFPRPIRNFVEKIQRNSQRMGNLIADLLDLSRLEANRRLIDKRAVNVRQVAETVFAALEEKAERGDCRLILEVEPNVWVLADSGALEQILTNFSENAIKYSGGGAVTIWAEKKAGMVHLGVDDEGRGIDEEHQARLFERFYRVDPGRSRDQGGTGLGLAIVKHLAEAMDGKVAVSSREPQGTRFWVELTEAGPGYRPSRARASRPPASP